MDERKAFFGSIAEARTWSGGNSYQGFLNNIEKEAFDNAPDVDRLAIEAAGLRKPFKLPPLPKPAGPGKDRTMADLLALERSRRSGRSFSNGKKMFAAARCIVCHRFYGDGGSTGPDMTQSAGRFSYKDMAESIVEPSKVVSDQYRASVVFTNSGKTYTGKIVSDTKTGITILTNPEDSTKVVEIKRRGHRRGEALGGFANAQGPSQAAERERGRRSDGVPALPWRPDRSKVQAGAEAANSEEEVSRELAPWPWEGIGDPGLARLIPMEK